jgi:hypothetical protein
LDVFVWLFHLFNFTFLMQLVFTAIEKSVKFVFNYQLNYNFSLKYIVNFVWINITIWHWHPTSWPKHRMHAHHQTQASWLANMRCNGPWTRNALWPNDHFKHIWFWLFINIQPGLISFCVWLWVWLRVHSHLMLSHC